MEDSKVLFCSTKFPWGTQRNFFESDRQFGHAPSKGFDNPDLDCLSTLSW